MKSGTGLGILHCVPSEAAAWYFHNGMSLAYGALGTILYYQYLWGGVPYSFVLNFRNIPNHWS